MTPVHHELTIKGMAIHSIRKYPDPVLKKVAATVCGITDEVRALADDMLQTMRAARGIGLAANQIGVPLRVVTLEGGLANENPPLVLINPEIVEENGEEMAEEGCLSLPGFYETFRRAREVKVRAITLDGKEFVMECAGLLARACQHEIDHLNGRLIVDYLSPVKKQLFRKEYLKE